MFAVRCYLCFLHFHLHGGRDTSLLVQLHAVVANSVPLTWAASISELWPQVTEIVEAESSSKSTAGGRRSISGFPLARSVPTPHSLPTMPLTLLCQPSSRARREMVRRQSTGGNDSPSFATTVIGCSDSTTDPNTNTTKRDVFRSLVGAARNISHMCTYQSPMLC